MTAHLVRWPHRCEVEGCTAPAVVGWGAVPEWVCQTHFELRLAAAGSSIAAIRKALR